MFPCELRYFVNFFAVLLTAMLLSGSPPAWADESVKAAAAETGVKTSNKTKESEKIDEEIAKARTAITSEPANASAHAHLAYLLIEKGTLDEAMKSFDDALRLNPRLYDAKTGKGIILARKGNLKEAEQVLKDALVLNPNPVRTHYELGLLYERLNEFEKAVAEFKKGIRKHEQGRM
jgi:tetratricopeptide (TPR) repeat protein